MVLVAVVGTGGLRPALAAIEAGKDLAVASKEILVMAGEIVMREARKKCVQRVAGRFRAQRDLSVFGRETFNVQCATCTAQVREFNVECWIVGRWMFLICVASF